MRGTSVSIARTPTTQNYTIAIIDSTRTGIDAASIANTSTPSLTPTSVSSGTYLSYISGTTTIPTRYVKSKTELLNIDPWIRDNTRADIDYLYIHSGSAQRIVDEYNATVPRSIDTLISDALCPEPAGTTSTVKRLYWISLIPYAKYLDKCRENTLLAFADYFGSTNFSNPTLGFASPMIYSGGTI